MEYLSFVDFYGLRIVKSEKAAVLKAFHRVIEMDGNLRVTTMNAQIAYYYLTMPAYQAALNDSLVVPDGVGLSWAVKKRMNTRINRFPGVELGIELCRIAAESGKTVFLYGSKPGVAEKAAAFLERETGVRIVGCRHGFNDSDEETQYGICRKISESGASILFVALGAPKQEIWLEKYFENECAHRYRRRGFARRMGGHSETGADVDPADEPGVALPDLEKPAKEIQSHFPVVEVYLYCQFRWNRRIKRRKEAV